MPHMQVTFVVRHFTNQRDGQFAGAAVEEKSAQRDLGYCSYLAGRLQQLVEEQRTSDRLVEVFVEKVDVLK